MMEQNFSIYSPPLSHSMFAYYFGKRAPTNPRKEDLEGLLWDDGTHLFAQMFYLKKYKMKGGEAQKIIKPRLKLPKTAEDFLHFIEPDFYTDAIAKCGKDVYIDKLAKIEKVKLQLKKRKIADDNTIAISKVKYGTTFDFWLFRSLPWSATLFFQRIRQLYQTGIIVEWKMWQFRIESWNDTVTVARSVSSEFKPLSLSASNVVVVFYIHALVLLIAVITLLIENTCRLCRKVWGLCGKFFGLWGEAFVRIANVLQSGVSGISCKKRTVGSKRLRKRNKWF